MSEPIARGAIVTRATRHTAEAAALAKESQSILKAFGALARVETQAPEGADFVVLLVEEGFDPDATPLPDLKDRAASALALSTAPEEGRAAVALARRTLREHGAALGARELVFTPEQFGYLGLESDGLRERLEILLRALVNDAERLRLRREGWEDPPA